MVFKNIFVVSALLVNNHSECLSVHSEIPLEKEEVL